MLVFSKAKLVFLAIPKTGTIAYETALAPIASMAILEPPELKHAPIYRYNRFFRPMLEKFVDPDIETLAVMREPISWLGSWYRYRQRPDNKGSPTSTQGISFDEFILSYMKGKKPAFADVGSQANFLKSQPNGTAITHLFKYENQAALISFLEERLETSLDLPRLNISPRIQLELSREVEVRYRAKFAAEFSLWESIG